MSTTSYDTIPRPAPPPVIGSAMGVQISVHYIAFSFVSLLPLPLFQFPPPPLVFFPTFRFHNGPLDSVFAIFWVNQSLSNPLSSSIKFSSIPHTFWALNHPKSTLPIVTLHFLLMWIQPFLTYITKTVMYVTICTIIRGPNHNYTTSLQVH